MAEPTKPASPSTPKPEPVQPALAPARSSLDSLYLTTPVILAVLVPLMLGRSSTEMTMAQYHRAEAAQHQSKAANQWGFFQAKRIRGTSYDAALDVVQA